MFSAATLDDLDAEMIAEAYFKGGRVREGIMKALGVSDFDMNLLRQALVRKHIAIVAKRMSTVYSLADHIQGLKEIRDRAMTDDSLKIALAAETQMGKAAGIYDIVNPHSGDNEDEQGKLPDPTKLDSAALRKRLANFRTTDIVPMEQGVEDAEMVEDEEDPDGTI